MTGSGNVGVAVNGWYQLQSVARRLQKIEHLRHTSAADSQKPRQRRSALELAGVEPGLVIPGEPERIAGRRTEVDLLLLR